MKIQGFSPEEYAALWGKTTVEGVYFYNFGSEKQVRSKEWLHDFAEIIKRLSKDIVGEWLKSDGKFDNDFQKDMIGLVKLYRHVKKLENRAKS